jgi:hypothetical protein
MTTNTNRPSTPGINLKKIADKLVREDMNWTLSDCNDDTLDQYMRLARAAAREVLRQVEALATERFGGAERYRWTTMRAIIKEYRK